MPSSEGEPEYYPLFKPRISLVDFSPLLLAQCISDIDIAHFPRRNRDKAAFNMPPFDLNPVVPDAAILGLFGRGLSYDDWILELGQQNYLWSKSLLDRIIGMEMDFFREEIQRLQREPNRGPELGSRTKTNSLESILKRLKGDIWVDGLPNERMRRRKEGRLLGKDAKIRCLQYHANRWNNRPSPAVTEASRYLNTPTPRRPSSSPSSMDYGAQPPNHPSQSLSSSRHSFESTTTEDIQMFYATDRYSMTSNNSRYNDVPLTISPSWPPPHCLDTNVVDDVAQLPGGVVGFDPYVFNCTTQESFPSSFGSCNSWSAAISAGFPSQDGENMNLKAAGTENSYLGKTYDNKYMQQHRFSYPSKGITSQRLAPPLSGIASDPLSGVALTGEQVISQQLFSKSDIPLLNSKGDLMRNSSGKSNASCPQFRFSDTEMEEVDTDFPGRTGSGKHSRNNSGAQRDARGRRMIAKVAKLRAELDEARAESSRKDEELKNERAAKETAERTVGDLLEKIIALENDLAVERSMTHAKTRKGPTQPNTIDTRPSNATQRPHTSQSPQPSRSFSFSATLPLRMGSASTCTSSKCNSPSSPTQKQAERSPTSGTFNRLMGKIAHKCHKKHPNKDGPCLPSSFSTSDVRIDAYMIPDSPHHQVYCFDLDKDEWQ